MARILQKKYITARYRNPIPYLDRFPTDVYGNDPQIIISSKRCCTSRWDKTTIHIRLSMYIHNNYLIIS